jgi:drug/metabolite transporter (DMT)-like permease
MVLLSRTSAVLASSYSFVNPVIAMLLGVSLGGEAMTSQEWIAVGVIVLGVTVIVIGKESVRDR